MPDFKQVDAEKSLLEAFLKFANVEDISVSAQRLTTKPRTIHDQWENQARLQRSRNEVVTLGSFFEMENRYRRLEQNNLYLTLSRPLLNAEWRKVSSLFTNLNGIDSFKTPIRITTEDNRDGFTIKMPGL